MAMKTPWWTWAWPLLALAMLGLQLLLHGNALTTAFEVFALIVRVFAAVYHAEVAADGSVGGDRGFGESTDADSGASDC
jgi:hypothetical protein